MKALLTVFLMLLSGFTAQGQVTRVEGHVYEDSSAVPLTFVKVYFQGTQTGTTTDTSGYFSLSITEKDLKSDTLVVSYLGYSTQYIPIQRGTNQSITVHLFSTLFQELDEITVRPGENPAWKFMRELIARKEANNPDNLSFYASKEYAKVRFDLNNFTDKTKKSLLLRPFDYIWENTQTTEDGVVFLPVLMTETVSEHYYRKDPRDQKDIVTGEKTTGLAGPKLVNFTNDLYLTPNIYDDFLTILDKSIPGPLNDNYKNNYKFYLMDSVSSGGRKTYQIRFKPKYDRELGFNGEIYFDSASYAITEVTLRLDVKANINFVRSYLIIQKYAPVDGKHWMLSESQVIGDFTVLENATDLTGFFGRKRAFFYDYKIESPIADEVFKGVDVVEKKSDYKEKDEAYWEKIRTEQLSAEETTLLNVTQRVTDDPAFKVRKNLILTFVTGYVPLKSVQLGNIYSFYSYNPVEHSRVKLGLRTNPRNNFPLFASAYAAYGTLDQQWKYSGQIAYNFTPKKTPTRVSMGYTYDIQQLGRSFNQIELDHVVSSLVQLGNTSSRNYVTQIDAAFEKGIVTGLIGGLRYFNSSYQPVQGNKYLRFDENNVLGFEDDYRASGMSVVVKFSHLYDQVSAKFYDEDDYYKESRKYPDLAVSYTFSDKNLFRSEFNFQKINLSIRQKVNARKLGTFRYNVETGKTFGEVPFVFLDLPNGNQLILADEFAFNLMNFMEFAADEYVMVHLAHHFEGLIMDRIPLINKLKWRSFVFGKGYFGSLSAGNNEQVYLFPQGLSAMGRPYYEVGFGLENIFKIARIDFVWRLTPGISEHYTFLVKPSFKFSF